MRACDRDDGLDLLDVLPCLAAYIPYSLLFVKAMIDVPRYDQPRQTRKQIRITGLNHFPVTGVVVKWSRGIKLVLYLVQSGLTYATVVIVRISLS